MTSHWPPLSYLTALVVEVTGHAHVLLAAFEKVSAILATNHPVSWELGQAVVRQNVLDKTQLHRTFKNLPAQARVPTWKPYHRLTFPLPATIFSHQFQYPQVPPGHSLA